MTFGGPPLGPNPYQDPSYLRAFSPGEPTPAPQRGMNGTVRSVAFALGATALTLATITAVLLLTDPVRAAGGAQGPASTADGTPGEQDAAHGRHPDDPRSAMPDRMGPVVAPDWQVVTSAQRYTAFDVPPDWGVGPEGATLSWARGGDLTIADPAVLWNHECEYWSEEALDDAAAQGADALLDARAFAGTSNRQGATDTEEASRSLAVDLLLANMSRSEGDRLDVTEAEPFGNEHGVAGHITTATLSGRQEDPDARCPVRDGMAIGISYISPDNDLVGWGLMTDIGYEDELPDETMEQIVGSIRYYNAG